MKLSCKKFFEYVIYETTDTYDLKKIKINRHYDIFNLSDYYENDEYINYFKSSSIIDDFTYSDTFVEEYLRMLRLIVMKKNLKFYIFFKIISISREMKISKYTNYYFIKNYELYIIYISRDEKYKVFKRFDGKLEDFINNSEYIVIELEKLKFKLDKKIYNNKNVYGYKECVLDFGVTSLLIHECFGHLVEKDTNYFKKSYKKISKNSYKNDLFLSDYTEGKDIILPIKIDDLGYISKNIKVCDYGKFKNYLEYGNYKI